MPALALAAAGLAFGPAAPTALAQDLTIRAPAQSTPIAITGARIYPVSGPVIADGYIVFDKGIITAVGAMPAGDAAPALPAGTKVIAGAGKHVYPGLISPMTQMGLDEIASVRATRDFNETGDLTPEAIAAVAINPDSNLLTVTRSNGVLICGTFPTGGLMPGQASVLALEGWTSEDLTLERSAGLCISMPLLRVVKASWMEKSAEEQQREMRVALERVREMFRLANAYRAALDTTPKPPIDTRLAALQPYLPTIDGKLGKRVFIEAAELDQILAGLALAKEFNLNVVIIGGRDAGLVAPLLAERNVPVIINATQQLPRRDDSPYNENFSLAKRLSDAKVKFAIASGEETPHERNLPFVAASAISYGLAWEDALRAVTLSAAEILGVADRVGSLEVGKHATLIVTDGPAMEVTTGITAAFIYGRQLDLSNKQSELAKKYREKYKQMGEKK